MQELVKKYKKGITGIAPEALEVLASAAWPGNVRQLYNVVEQSCALATTPILTLTLIQRALRVPSLEALSYAEAKQRFERNYLVQLLKLTEGSVADAATSPNATAPSSTACCRNTNSRRICSAASPVAPG